MMMMMIGQGRNTNKQTEGQKLITIKVALYLLNDIERYVSRKGGRGLSTIEDCVDTSIQGIDDNIAKSN